MRIGEGMKPTSISYWNPESGSKSETAMPAEPSLHSSPPVQRLLAILSLLGIFLLLLLACQGCGNNQPERALERGLNALRKGDYDLAIADYSEAIHLKPDFVEAYINRGYVYGQKRDYDRAIADYNEAVRLQPNGWLAYINRANSYEHKGDWDRAIADYTEAMRAKPNNVKYPEANISLARLLAVCPDAHFRNGSKAVEYAT